MRMLAPRRHAVCAVGPGTIWVCVLLLLVGWTVRSDAEIVRMVVADAPYDRVWDAANVAVDGYPLERASEQVIESAWWSGHRGPVKWAFGG